MELNKIDLTIKQEYDVVYLCKQFEEHRKVMIRAEFAGSGKSYCCEHMTKICLLYTSPSPRDS